MRFTVDGVRRGPETSGQVLDLRRPTVAADIVDGIRRLPMSELPSQIATATMAEATIMAPTVASPSRKQLWWLMAAPVAVVALVFAAQFVQSNLPVKVSTTSAPAVSSAAPQPKPILPATANLDLDLQKILSDFSAAQPVPVAIVAKDLKTGKYATLNADTVFTSASLYKLFVANQILYRHDYQGLSLSAPSGGEAGNRNIKQCLEIMINISDNACGRALGTMLGWGKHNPVLKSEGYNNTDLTGPYQKTSAGDVAKLLEQLYTTEFLKPISNNLFLQYLKDQKVTNRLPVGLPADTEIAHKTGDLEGNVHDAGIVYGAKTDYLVVMLSGPWQKPADAQPVFKDLSAKLYAYFNP